jgi:hypothetical protein
LAIQRQFSGNSAAIQREIMPAARFAWRRTLPVSSLTQRVLSSFAIRHHCTVSPRNAQGKTALREPARD